MLKAVLGRSVSVYRRKFSNSFSLGNKNWSSTATMAPKYLDQGEAINIDKELFSTYGFSVDQLMELAGLSVAHAASKFLEKGASVLVMSGPGNNGGDGLVCARHLKLFGYKPFVLYPKESKNDLMIRLVTQINKMDIPFINEQSIHRPSDISDHYSFVIDAIFGFSFVPPIREPFNRIIELISQSKVRVLSVDIPSGWHVENGPLKENTALEPYALISLTAPKKCARFFQGHAHFLGGRFVPSSLADRYALDLPEYPGTDPIVRLN